MIEAITKLSHKEDYETPKKVFDYICHNYHVQPTIDVCASESNRKCKEWIDKERDVFRTNFEQSFFMNPPYRKATKDVTGVGDFIKRAYEIQLRNQVTGTIIVFSNISSSSYFKKYVGETELDRMENHVELNFLPFRVNFEWHGIPVGTPAFASMVIIYRH